MTTKTPRPKLLPALAVLEGRQLLASIHFDHILMHKSIAASVQVLLDGTLAGTSSSVKSSTTGPETLHIAFRGAAGSMGEVGAVFTERVEFATAQIVSGTLVLKNKAGSVSLGFAAAGVLENTYATDVKTTVIDATIVSSSGVFAHSAGQAVVAVTERAGDPEMQLSLDSVALP